MELTDAKILLNQVKSLNDAYEKIDLLTGENFNIFRILKLESSEVRLHSAFIAALLDPKGPHGQKDVFLKLFIDLFCFKKQLIQADTCVVEVEKHTGFINAEGTAGGRIDIVITDRTTGYKILIENKIYAGDQSNQLTRYYNHASNADLIYLTLDGKDPSLESKGNLMLDEHYKCYSYKKDILLWLEECCKEVATYPIVRESITQYINLIKYLTNRTVNDTMQEEINELLLSNIDASFLIANHLDNTLDKLWNDKFIPQLKLISKDLNLECSDYTNFDSKFNGIHFSKERWKWAHIEFQFQNYDKSLIFGIAANENPKQVPFPAELRQALSSIPNNSTRLDIWWPWHQPIEEPLDDWQKPDAWKAIMDGTIVEIMKEKIKFVLEHIERNNIEL